MANILKAVSGDELRDIAVLKEGVELILGRNFDVDICIAGDPKISGNHLKIRSINGEVEIEDLNSTNGTYVDEQQVRSAKLTSGGAFRCGGTEFVIFDESAPSVKTTISEMDAVAAVPSGAPAFAAASAVEVVERFQIATQLPEPPQPDEPAADYAIRLANGAEPNHCVTFMAYALEKRTAVWWLTRCIAQVECFMDDNDRIMFELAEKWVKEPTDANRRKAMAHAEKMEMSTPSCWAAVGAFWSGGSMAPVDAPVVEPKDNLAGKAISGGAILASVFKKPEEAFAKQKSFVQIGVDIGEGRLPWA